jgi:FAD/FMN-containing dehydrogenase
MLSFDPTTGWLRCEAGVTLEEIIRTFGPRGFFPPVVPGTQFVTVAGALANDIHGKNHHVDGTFAQHVRRVELLTASGDVVSCDDDHERELFEATAGGLGLTGLILALDLKLQPIASPFIELESIRVENLDRFFEVSQQSGGFSHTVSWIDCIQGGKAMGRGIFMRGRHASPETDAATIKASAGGRPFQVPMDAPGWLMNGLSMRLFNAAYFRKHPRGQKNALVHYAPFFFPLDAIGGWNRIYGKRGMLQYQLVVPPDPEHRAVRAVLETVTRAGQASFLSVIKEFGDSIRGGLSFPRPGCTLALDFPNTGRPLLELLNRLDDIVADAGGRVYLGKDARLSRDKFRRMYPEWSAWKHTRDQWDPQGVFQSSLGLRLGLVGGEE